MPTALRLAPLRRVPVSGAGGLEGALRLGALEIGEVDQWMGGNAVH